MSYKLAVFDWNGTLFDDIQYIVDGLNHGLALIGYPAVTIEEYRAAFDSPIKLVYENLGVDENILNSRSAEIAQTFERFYEPLALQAKTRLGAKQLLSSLSVAGKNCVVLSNHTTRGIRTQLARLNLEPYIQSVLANDVISDRNHKSKEGRLKDYLSAHDYKPSEVIIVGDTIEETRIARNIGASSIAITGGACSLERLQQIQPDYIVNELSNVMTIMEALA